MKPFLYEKLFAALLVELANATTPEHRRFLSTRKICERWSVSAPTAESALRRLQALNLLYVRPRSGFYVAPKARRHALHLLGTLVGMEHFPQKTFWSRKRLQLLQPQRSEGQSIALIFDSNLHNTFFNGATPEFLDPYSLQCARGAQQAAAGRFALDFFGVDPLKPAMLPNFERVLGKRRFNGIIVFRRNQNERTMKPFIEKLQRYRIPIVCAFYSSEDTEAYAIDFNNVSTGYRAGRIFLGKGLRRIGVLVPPGADRNAMDRIRGVQLAVDELNDPNAQIIPIRFPFDSPFPQALAQRIADPAAGIEALYSPGHADLHNLGQLLRRYRLSIPRDISVIITSSLSRAEGLDREVDTMKIDFREMGVRSLHLMADLLSGTGSIPKLTLLNLEYQPKGTVPETAKNPASLPPARG